MRCIQFALVALIALVASAAARIPFGEKPVARLPEAAIVATAPITEVVDVTAADLLEAYNSHKYKLFIIDVRDGVTEYAPSHIPTAVNIPLPNITFAFDSIPTNKYIYVHCKAGYRSAQAAAILSERGFAQVYNVKDGFDAWKGPTEKLDELNKLTQQADVELRLEELRIIDVRPVKDFAQGHIPGAVNAPSLGLKDLRFAIPTLFVGEGSEEGFEAGEFAVASGVVGVMHLEGGMNAWTGPVVRTSAAAAPVAAAVPAPVRPACNRPGCGLF
jgi:rhodanese-related sulfurtransferase